MKLSSKGFAVTSIIYSMLVLFLALVLLIMSNLASRKVLFDKEKNEILDKINGNNMQESVKTEEERDTEALELYGLTYYIGYIDSQPYTYVFRISADKVPDDFYNEHNDFAYYSDYNYTTGIWAESDENKNKFLNEYNEYLTEIANYIFANYDPVVWGSSDGFFLGSLSSTSGIKINKDSTGNINIEIAENA